MLFEYSKTNLLDKVTDGGLIYEFSHLGTREVTVMYVTFPGSEEKSVRYQYDSYDRLLKQSFGITNYHLLPFFPLPKSLS